MQAQATRQTQITSAQSLLCVQTLLTSGLSCITFLRDLLPDENFSEVYLTSSNNGDSFSSQSSRSSQASGSFISESSERRKSNYKVMTIKRNYTDEADKLLDFLENGIFDALQKQYLRSFTLAIYLDAKDPNNIVEAYTFNFNYYTIPGTNTTIPIMSLGDELMKMSLHGRAKTTDPVADALKNGKAPTLGEVKRSLKALVRNLVKITTHLDALPKRRYATFKLFYHDNTPDDYEPPHFRSGDVEKDKWYFATHEKTEVPERFSIGSLNTGWHGVDVSVRSVVSYLPSREDNEAMFAGTTGCQPVPGQPSLTPVEEAQSRAQQIEVQGKDAEERCIIWDVDGLTDMDADGEDDPDYVGGQARVDDSGIDIQPYGVRGNDGTIVPFVAVKARSFGGPEELSARVSQGEEEAIFVGMSESVPKHVDQLNTKMGDLTSPEIAQTQALEFTQELPLSPVPRTSCARPHSSASLPPSDVGCESFSLPSFSGRGTGAEEVDTQLLVDKLMDNREDTEMLDMETQVVPSVPIDESDSIESFESGKITPKAQGTSKSDLKGKGKVKETIGDKGLDCECGSTIDDASCFCDGGCQRWYHVWCMGYHSVNDKRLPTHFVCFDCRVRSDQNWDFIVVNDLYPSMISKFKDLALFRRAIKVAETHEPESLSEFMRLIGCESVLAGQLFRRLEAEGFIAVDAPDSDGLGLRGRGKARGKQVKPRKAMQKTKYVFVRSAKRSALYQDYFNPDDEVERKTLGLSQLKPKNKRKKRVEESNASDPAMGFPIRVDGPSRTRSPTPPLPLPVAGSQTQEETQILPDLTERRGSGPLKRRADESAAETIKAPKKVKISLAGGLELEN